MTAIVVVTMAALVPGCSTRDASTDASRTIRIAFGIGPSAKASGINVLTDLLYTDPLIAHDASGRPTPSLAESWQWDDHGRLLTLRLKPGVKFHDGTPMTSQVVLELLNRTRAPARGSLPLGFERITEVAAPDASTLTIRLEKPDIFLFSELNELRVYHPAHRDIGTGPFRLIQRQPTVEVQRFDEYHGGLPGAEAVQIRTYETHRGAWAALMRGEVDAAQEVSRESVEFMERSSNLRTYSSMQPYYIPLVFNQQHPMLGRREVRQAISLALDREGIVAQAMRGHGAVAADPIWPSHWAYQPPTGAGGYDPARAAMLLDRLGLTLPTARSTEPRVRFAFRCLFWSEDPQYERIALMLQKQLFDIGVQLDLEPVTLATLAERAGAGDFDAFLARANAGRTLMFTYRFWRSSGADQPAFWRTGYTGADLALDRLRESQTEAETRAALAEVARRFRDDVPAAFIAWTEVTRALNADITVSDSNLHDPFTAIWRWARAPGGTVQ
jgi:peptide/nickel transport system substrate-binding protein